METPGALIVNGTTPQARWEECEGIAGIFDALRHEARALVPEAFRLEAGNEETVPFRFHALRCERVATNDRVFMDVGLLRIAAEVQPVNETWATGVSYYTVMLLVTDGDLAAFLETMGLKVVAAPLTAADTEAAEGTRMESWTFGAAGFTVGIDFALNGDGQENFTEDWSFWNPWGPGFRRMEAQRACEYDALIRQAGMMRIVGSSGIEPLMVAGTATPWTGAGYWRTNEIWSGNATIYRE